MENTKFNEKGEKGSTEYMTESKTNGTQFVLSDYEDWWDCSVRKGIISIICPTCKEKYNLQNSLFNSKAAKLNELVLTGLNIFFDNPAIIKFSRFFAVICALIIGPLIASLFGSPPFLWVIFSAILIPVLWPITTGIFVSMSPKKAIPVWTYKCKKCGEKIVIASDGIKANVGSRKEDVGSRKEDVGSKKADESFADALHVEAIIEGLHNKDYLIRIDAAKAFGENKYVSGVEPLIQVLKDKNRMVRNAAAEALGKIGDKRGVEPLIQVAQEDKSTGVRTTSIEALAAIGDTKVFEPIQEFLNDKKWLVRDAAKQASKKLGPTESIIEDLYNENWPVRQSAAEILGVRKDVSGVEPLIQVLKDKNSWVRDEAVKALGKIGDKRGVEPLIQVAQEDKSSSIRQTSISALAVIGHTMAIEPIRELLNDKKRLVRDAAKQALKKFESIESEIKNTKTEK